MLLGTGFHLGQTPQSTWLYGLVLFALASLTAVQAFAWGMLSSAVCRTSLGAIGVAAPPIVVVWGLALFVAGASERGIIACIALQCIPAGLALYTSWFLYAREDVRRAQSAITVPRPLALVWAILRRGRATLVLLGVLAVAFGCVLPRRGPLVWPAFTLLLGLICGLSVFATERSDGGHRFLTDRRLQLTWFWPIKVAVWLTIGVAALLFAMLVAGTLLQFGGHADQLGAFDIDKGLFDRLNRIMHSIMLRSNTFRDAYLVSAQSLLFWPAYAFGAGVIGTLLTPRKWLAAFLSLLLSICLIGLWMPSWFAGGLSWLQLFGVPLLLVPWSGLLFPASSEGRLFQGRGLAGLVACGLSIAAWTCANFWYRVAQVPNLGEPFNVQAYLASAPTGQQNEAGHLVEAICRELPGWAAHVREEVGPLSQPPFPEVGLGETNSGLAVNTVIDVQNPRYEYYSQADEVLRQGWPAHPGKLGEWLQQMCAGEWAFHARETVPLAVGVIRFPRPDWLTHRIPETYREAETVLGARALQLQAAGNDSEAFDCIAAGLAIARTLGNRAESIQLRQAFSLETIALRALLSWSKKRGLTSAQLERALRELKRQAAENATPLEALKADYVAQLRFMDAPTDETRPTSWYDPLTIELTRLTMCAPWERARSLKSMNQNFQLARAAEAGSRQARRQLRQHETFLPGSPIPVWHVGDRDRLSLLRRSEIVLALLIYRDQHHGQMASTLADLVPALLPAVPVNPDTEQPFAYRIARAGDKVVQAKQHWEQGGLVSERIKVAVPAGRGILEWDDSDGGHAWIVPSMQ